MTGVLNSRKGTRSDGGAESQSRVSCRVVLTRVKLNKIPQRRESPAEQSKQDTLCNDPAGAESDSGDSLFITQKTTTKQHNRSSKSSPASDEHLEEGGGDTLSSSQREPKTRKKKKFKLPKHNFHFLTESKGKHRTVLPSYKNERLHNVTMGGFFIWVRELWQSTQRQHEVLLPPPTLDMDGDYIHPLSEEEDASQDEDIKVVDKKHFAASSKAKCSQPWYNPVRTVKQQMRTASTSIQEMSKESQRLTLHETPAKEPKSRATLSSDTESSDSGDSSGHILPERRTNDTSIHARTEAPTTDRHLTRGSTEIIFQEMESENELSDNDVAAVCETPEPTTVTEAPTDGSHTDDLTYTKEPGDEPESQSLLQLPELENDPNNDSVSHERRVTKKNAKKDVDEVSQEEPESLHTAVAVNVEATVDEPPALQVRDELELNGNNWTGDSSHGDNILRQEERGIPDSTQMKRKSKKNKSAADNVTQEMDGKSETDLRLEDSGFPDQVKKKKKKKRMKSVDDEGVEQLESSVLESSIAGADVPNYDAEINRRKKKKKKKEKRIAVTEECEENTEVSEGTLESGYEEKRQKHKNKQQPFPLDDTQVSEEGGVDVNLSNDAVMLEGSTGHSMKKKKKKREGNSEAVDISYTPDKSKMVESAHNSENTIYAQQVTEKKEEIIEIGSRNDPEESVAQSDDPVRKKKKKKKKNRTSSFLDAYSEEKDAQSDQQQSFCSEFVAAHVWLAEKPGVSADDVESKSAEITGMSGDGVRKKKRKMSAALENVEKGHEADTDEPEETCEASGVDTVVKRKKKRKRTESESVTPAETLDSAPDEGQTDDVVVLKKKKKKKRKDARVAAFCNSWRSGVK